MERDHLQQIDVVLTDNHAESSGKARIRVEAGSTGIRIFPEGYGDYGSDYGAGAPIILEVYDGKLQLVAWADINCEHPTQIISLEGARENLRTEPAEH